MNTEIVCSRTPWHVFPFTGTVLGLCVLTHTHARARAAPAGRGNILPRVLADVKPLLVFGPLGQTPFVWVPISPIGPMMTTLLTAFHARTHRRGKGFLEGLKADSTRGRAWKALSAIPTTKVLQFRSQRTPPLVFYVPVSYRKSIVIVSGTPSCDFFQRVVDVEHAALRVLPSR